MALLIAQQHLKGPANQNWKERQGKSLVSAGNWRAWIASLVSDVIGEDGEERLLLSLLQVKANLYKDVEHTHTHALEENLKNPSLFMGQGCSSVAPEGRGACL